MTTDPTITGTAETATAETTAAAATGVSYRDIPLDSDEARAALGVVIDLAELVTMEGHGLVTDADGTVRYDNPADNPTTTS